MKFLETSNLYSLNKSTYVNLRWISYFGQLTAILIVEFFLKFEFNYLLCISIVFLSILTNLYLIFKIKYHLLNNFIATSYLSYDIGQLCLLIYLTGGITNPLVFLIIIPSIFSAQYLNIWSSIVLVISEETAKISLAENGRFIKIGMDEMDLRRHLNERMFISSGD